MSLYDDASASPELPVIVLLSEDLLKLQVEIVPEGGQSGPIHGTVCGWISLQYTAFAVWVLISATVPVIHGPHPVGCVPGNGHSWFCVFVLVYIQDLCVCQSRLEFSMSPAQACISSLPHARPCACCHLADTEVGLASSVYCWTACVERVKSGAGRSNCSSEVSKKLGCKGTLRHSSFSY